MVVLVLVVGVMILMLVLEVVETILGDSLIHLIPHAFVAE